MAEKVAKVGIKREAGYLYFLDKKGNVARAKMARGKKKGKSKITVVIQNSYTGGRFERGKLSETHHLNRSKIKLMLLAVGTIIEIMDKAKDAVT